MFRDAVAITQTHTNGNNLVALCDVNQTRLALSASRVPDQSGNGIATYHAADFDQMLEAMGRFNEEMISAGVLLAAEGLDDAAETVVVDYSSTPPLVTDGPYGETKELFGGYWIVDVASKEEAVEWAKRAPMAGPGMKTEIRRVPSIDEFPQDNIWIQKERAWRERSGQL